jgi:hypothetical protein
MSREFHTDISMQSGARITGLPAAVAADEPVNLAQMQAQLEGVSWKDSVRVASTANLTLSGPGATIDAITMSSGDRVLVKNQTTQSENGIYIWTGAATPMTRATDASTFQELEAAVVIVEEGTANIGTKWRQTQVNGTIGSSNVVWAADTTTVPSASESTAGTLEIATQGETDAGTDDARAVTPLKLANWSGRKRKGSTNIGDGSATSFNIDHNFGFREVVVEVYKNSGNFDTVIVDVTRPTANRVTLTFAAAPALNAYTVVVMG